MDGGTQFAKPEDHPGDGSPSWPKPRGGTSGDRHAPVSLQSHSAGDVERGPAPWPEPAPPEFCGHAAPPPRCSAVVDEPTQPPMQHRALRSAADLHRQRPGARAPQPRRTQKGQAKTEAIQ